MAERIGSKDKQEIYLDRIRMHTGHAVRTGKPKEGLIERTGSQDKQERYTDRIGMNRMHVGGPGVSSPEALKVHKIEIFFGFDFEICIISLLVISKC